jgi:hypothetical protein
MKTEMMKVKTIGWSGPPSEIEDEIALSEAIFAWDDMKFLVCRAGSVPAGFRYTDGACWSDWKDMGTDAQLVRLLGIVAEVVFTTDDRYELLIHGELLKVTEYRDLLVARGVCTVI